MMTPARGDFIARPLNADGDKIGSVGDPAADVASQNECKPFGAAGILRLPTRVRFEWVDDKTLKMEMDLGTQTRLLLFDKPQPTGERTWQGYANAEWIDLPVPGRMVKAAAGPRLTPVRIRLLATPAGAAAPRQGVPAGAACGGAACCRRPRRPWRWGRGAARAVLRLRLQAG